MEPTEERPDPHANVSSTNAGSYRWHTVQPPLYPDCQGFSMTVADMDFPLAEQIKEAIVSELSKPNTTLCYAMADPAWRKTVADWILQEWGFPIAEDLLVQCAGIFEFISVCVDAFLEQGEAYISLTPLCEVLVGHSYYSGRTMIESRLQRRDGKFQINFEQLEQLMRKPEVKMLLFVSPHAATGRVWSSDEVEQVVKITERHGKILLSDELYGNLARKPFTSALKYADRLKDKLIVCNSPSKSFNVSGSACGYGIMPNAAALARFKQIQLFKYTVIPSCYSMLTLKACYGHGKRWLVDTIEYIRENLEFIEAAFRQRFPKIQINIPEAGFAVLLNFEKYGLSSPIVNAILRKHNIAMCASGMYFTPRTESLWFRMVVASNREYLGRFLNRFEVAVAEMQKAQDEGLMDHVTSLLERM